MSIRPSRHGGYIYFEKAGRASSWGGCYEGWRAVVVGNGESRVGLDLSRLRYSPKTIFLACNGFYIDVLSGKEPVPNFLGAVDPFITREILESGYGNRYYFLVNPINLESLQNRRFQEAKTDALPEPDPLECPTQLIEIDYRLDYNCGVEMTHFALRLGCESVVLVGFDGPGEDVNNVYKDRSSCLATPKTPGPGQLQMRTLRRKWESVPFYQIDTDWIDDAETISFSQAVDLGVKV